MPARPVHSGGPEGFPRAIVTLQGLITSSLRQGQKITVLAEGDLDAVWRSIVGQVLAHDLLLAPAFDMPQWRRRPRHREGAALDVEPGQADALRRRRAGPPALARQGCMARGNPRLRPHRPSLTAPPLRRHVVAARREPFDLDNLVDPVLAAIGARPSERTSLWASVELGHDPGVSITDAQPPPAPAPAVPVKLASAPRGSIRTTEPLAELVEHTPLGTDEPCGCSLILGADTEGVVFGFEGAPQADDRRALAPARRRGARPSRPPHPRPPR